MTKQATNLPMKLSAVIITLNEEKNIERCIRSLLPVADEIVVVDSGSADRTAEIAESLGAKVVFNAFKGHIEQKNVALKMAIHPLVLSLDADEALSEELAGSLQKVKKSPWADCYSVNRLTQYCGKWIRHGGWYPDTKIRLVRNLKASWGGTNPHDKMIPEKGATVGHIHGNLLHYSIHSLTDHLLQIDYFTTIAARQRVEKGKKLNLIKLIVNPFAKFFKDYFLRLGFLDGYTGFVIASLSGYATFLKYLKTGFYIRERDRSR